MKTILFFTDTPLFGGAEKQMLSIIDNLNEKEFKCVLAIRKKSELHSKIHNYLKKKSVEIIGINSNHKNGLNNFFELRKTIAKYKPDLIHAHLWNPLACKMIYPFKIFWNIPLVVTEHDPLKLNFVKKIIKNFFYLWTDIIICVSKENKKCLAKEYPKQKKKISVILNGIDIKKKISIKATKNINEKSFLKLLSVGTLHERKGHEFLIEAMPKILKAFPETKLKIAGDGPEKEKLKKLIKNLHLDDNVILLGFTNKIQKLMKNSDMFVLPSLKEAFGLVVLEAMKERLPVVASDSGGIPEIITHKKTGILVPPKNSEAIANAIINLAKDIKLQKKIIKNASENLTYFSIEKMIEKTEKLYKSYIK